MTWKINDSDSDEVSSFVSKRKTEQEIKQEKEEQERQAALRLAREAERRANAEKQAQLEAAERAAQIERKKAEELLKAEEARKREAQVRWEREQEEARRAEARRQQEEQRRIAREQEAIRQLEEAQRQKELKVRLLKKELSSFTEENCEEILLSMDFISIQKQFNSINSLYRDCVSGLEENIKGLWQKLKIKFERIICLFQYSKEHLASTVLMNTFDLQIVNKILKDEKVFHLPKVTLGFSLSEEDVHPLADIAQRARQLIFQDCVVGNQQSLILKAAFELAKQKPTLELAVKNIYFNNADIEADVYDSIMLFRDSPGASIFKYGVKNQDKFTIGSHNEDRNKLEIYKQSEPEPIQAFLANRLDKPWDVSFKDGSYIPGILPENTKNISISGLQVTSETIEALKQDFKKLTQPARIHLDNISYVGSDNAAEFLEAILTVHQPESLVFSEALGRLVDRRARFVDRRAIPAIIKHASSNTNLTNLSLGERLDTQQQNTINSILNYNIYLKKFKEIQRALDARELSSIQVSKLADLLHDIDSEVRALRSNPDLSGIKIQFQKQYSELVEKVVLAWGLGLRLAKKWDNQIIAVLRCVKDFPEIRANFSTDVLSLAEDLLIKNFYFPISSSNNDQALLDKVNELTAFVSVISQMKENGISSQAVNALLETVGVAFAQALTVAYGIKKPRQATGIAEQVLEKIQKIEEILQLDPASLKVIQNQILSIIFNEQDRHIIVARSPQLESYLLAIHNGKSVKTIHYQIEAVLPKAVSLAGEERWLECFEKIKEAQRLLATASTPALHEYFAAVLKNVTNAYLSFYQEDKSDKQPLKKPIIIDLLVSSQKFIDRNSLNDGLFEFYKIRVMRAIVMNVGKVGQEHGVSGLLAKHAELLSQKKIKEKTHYLVKNIQAANDLRALAGAVATYIAEESVWGKWVANSNFVTALSNIKAEMDDLVLVTELSQQIPITEPVVTAGEASGEPAATTALEDSKDSSSQSYVASPTVSIQSGPEAGASSSSSSAVEHDTGIQALIDELATLEPPSAQGKAEEGAWLEQQLGTFDRAYCCPISLELMLNPVIAADGRTYEYSSIKLHMQKNKDENGNVLSPLTNRPLSHLELTSDLRMIMKIKKGLKNLIVQAQANRAHISVAVQQENPSGFNPELGEVELQQQLLTPGASLIDSANVPVPEPDSNASIPIAAYNPELSQGELFQAKAETPGEGSELNLPPEIKIEEKPPVSVFNPSILVFEQTPAVKAEEAEKDNRDAVSAQVLTQGRNPGVFSAHKHDDDVASLLAQAPAAPQQTLVVKEFVEEPKDKEEKRQQLGAT